MAFQDIIEAEIRREAQKIATRHQMYHNNLYLAHLRNGERIAQAPARHVQTPPYWQINRRFNPFYVLNHAHSIARSITRKLRDGTYVPNPPHVRQIPKPSGGTRDIRVYEIHDAALSHHFYERILKKNRHRMSASAYAYRADKNVHFAIQDIAIDLRYYSRLFIAEFDFSDFFGSIRHDYLFAQFNQNGFLISPEEETVMKSFLTQYGNRGIPQGTSISLFLANLVCWRLDKQLESLGLKFARYADDSIIWSNDYARICHAFDIVHDFSSETGVAVNVQKSEGISLLVKDGLRSEFGAAKSSFNFLGYKLSVDKVAITERAVKKIKKQLSYLLYRDLIQPLLGNQLRAVVIPANDEDRGFLVAMSKIRRYLYGNLTEEYLVGYLRGVSTTISFKGIMSFYPLVDDEDQLRSLDGWLVAVIHRALKKRAQLLKHWHYNRDHQFPFNVPKEQLVRRCAQVVIANRRLLAIPSFLRIFRAMKMGITSGGIEQAMNAHSNDYLYGE
jgi:RNA-directed DNA polymerase